jgi:pyrroline-5-carboxylate reductase
MNKNFGLIGLGNMGAMILDQLLKLNLLNEKDVYAANRSKEKLDNFQKQYNSINLCNNIEVAKNCRNIMLCVEPSNVPNVLLDIVPYLNENSYLMISTATIAYNDLYKIYKGKITKFMPTLNSTVRGGVTLVCHNELVSDEEKNYFGELMSGMSEVQVIKEEDMNLCHNLTGSLPAVISEFMLEFVRAASKHSINMTMEEIEHMVMVSLAGASKLFIEKNMKFEDTINRVSTKGGITFEGIKIYEKKLPDIFNEAFDTTIKKYDDITNNVSKIIDDLVK